MLRRCVGFVALVALLLAGSGVARFLHLHATHAVPSPANAGQHVSCHHHTSPATDKPAPAPQHSSERCETCFLIAATLKGPVPALTVLPAADPLIIERIDVLNATIVAISRLDPASQRAPPAIST